jgi:hypothetical protein
VEDHQRRYSARLDQLAAGSRERTRRDLAELLGTLPPDAAAGPAPTDDQIEADFRDVSFSPLPESAMAHGRKLDELRRQLLQRGDHWLFSSAPSAGATFVSSDDALSADCAKVDQSFCDRYLPPGARWQGPRAHLCHTPDEFVDIVIRELGCSNSSATRQTLGERRTLTLPGSGTLVNVARLDLAANHAAWSEDVRMDIIGDLARGRIGRGLLWSRLHFRNAEIAAVAWRQDVLGELGLSAGARPLSDAAIVETILAASMFPAHGWIDLAAERVTQQLGIRRSLSFTTAAAVVKEALRLVQQVVLDGAVRDVLGVSLPLVAITNLVVGLFKIAYLTSKGDSGQAKALHECMNRLRPITNASPLIKGFDLAGWLGKWLLMSIETRQGSSVSTLEAAAWSIAPIEKLVALPLKDCAERLTSRPLSCPDTRLLALTQLREKGNLTRLADAQWGFLEKD